MEVHMDENLTQLSNAHFAEYTALTMRLTYWIYIQYAVYGLAAVGLGVVARVFQPDSKPYECWIFLFIVLTIGWAILQTQQEIVSTAIYIERDLRPAIQRLLLDSNDVWRWEQFVNETRGREQGVIGWERVAGLLPLFGAGIIAGLAILFVRLKHNLPPRLCSIDGWYFAISNLFWTLLAVYLVLIIGAKTKNNFSLHRELDLLVRHAMRKK